MFDAKTEQEVFGSAGIDAFTITSKSVWGRAEIGKLFSKWRDEERAGEIAKEWAALGYKGWQKGSVRYGSRRDSSILMCTGKESEEMILRAVLHGDISVVKATRIDLCIDFAMQKNKRGWLSTLRYNKEFEDLHKKQRREVSLIDSFSGQTLYIGKRDSAKFGRIYDKSIHYGLEQGEVYRFEIEAKKNVAMPVFNCLFPDNGDGEIGWEGYKDRLKQVLRGQFHAWGVEIGSGIKSPILLRGEALITTVDTQLEWLSTQVAPVVGRLRTNGYEQQTMAALFGDDYGVVV